MNTRIQTASILIAITGVAACSLGQTLEDLRDDLRNSLNKAQFASSLSGLILLSDELELSGARYQFDDGNSNYSDTRVKAFSLPLHKRLRPWKDSGTSIYLEGVIGYGRGYQNAYDIYDGLLPGLETSADGVWSSMGGLIGVGPEFRINSRLTIAPLLNGGLSYIKNETDYDGPGAAVSQALFDGLAFNWRAWTGSIGTAFRGDWIHPLGQNYMLEIVGRYDIRWTETLKTDDKAQEFSSRFQIITLRSDLIGPTGLSLLERALYWRAFSGYRGFIDGDLYGVEHVFLLGAGLEYDIDEMLPYAKRFTLKGGILLGEDLTGYTFGAGLSF